MVIGSSVESVGLINRGHATEQGGAPDALVHKGGSGGIFSPVLVKRVDGG